MEISGTILGFFGIRWEATFIIIIIPRLSVRLIGFEFKYLGPWWLQSELSFYFSLMPILKISRSLICLEIPNTSNPHRYPDFVATGKGSFCLPPLSFLYIPAKLRGKCVLSCRQSYRFFFPAEKESSFYSSERVCKSCMQTERTTQ